MGQGCLGPIAMIAIIVGVAGAGYYFTNPQRQIPNTPPAVIQPTSTLSDNQGSPEDTSLKQGTFNFDQTTIVPPTSPPSLTCKNIDISMIIDRSSSMNAIVNGKKKLEYAKQAASTLAGSLASMQASNPNSVSNVRVGVVSFGRQGDVNDPTLGNLIASETPKSIEHIGLTGNFTALVNAVANVQFLGSGTCIQCGLKLANRQLGSVTGDKMKVAILLSDGMANKVWPGNAPGDSTSKQKAIEQAQIGKSTLGIEYRVVGYGESGNIDPNTLKTIAGPAENYQQMADPNQWTNTFLTILNDICQESSALN